MTVREPKQTSRKRTNSSKARVSSRRPSTPSKRRQQPEQQPRLSPLAVMHGLTSAVTGGALLLALMAGFAFWRSGSRFMDGLKLILSPPPPEDVVDVRSVVVQQIRNASELTTAVFAMETVVPAESDRTFAGYTIGQTNLLYIAHGEVRAGIDLSELTPDDVLTTTDANGVTVLQVQLPAPRLLDSKIDVSRSQVYDYDRGFLNLGPDRAPQLQSLAQQTALTHIEQAACEEGILTMASDRATLVVKQLLSSTGYSQVTVETVTPESCNIVSPAAGSNTTAPNTAVPNGE